MSFNYSGDPSASDLDAVRYLMGDTVSTGHVAADEEILWCLSQESDLWFAAAMACEAVSAKYASQPTSKMIGETQVTYGELSGKWNNQAATLRAQRRSGAFDVFAGGIYSSQKEEEEQDTDREELAVTKGVHDNLEALSNDRSTDY